MDENVEPCVAGYDLLVALRRIHAAEAAGITIVSVAEAICGDDAEKLTITIGNICAALLERNLELR